MKYFYNAKPSATVTRPAAKASGTAQSSAKKIFMLVLLGFFLLMSGEGYGQVTYYSNVNDGDWYTLASWSTTDNINANQAVIPSRLPTATDNIVVRDGNIIRLSQNAAVNKVTIRSASTGNTNNTVSQLVLNSGAVLSVVDFELNGGNGQRKAAYIANNGTLKVSGNLTLLATANITFNAGTGTVEYSGTSTTQAIASINYYNLTLSGTGSKTVSTGLSILGSLTINTGATFDAGSYTHTISGNLTNAGSFNSSTSTIALNGVNKTISSTGSGTFNNLTLSNGGKSLLSNVTVNGVVNLENSILNTGEYTAILGASGNIASSETATQHIIGAIETTRSLPANRTNTEIFGNIGLRIPTGTTDLESIKVRRVTGKVYVSPITGNNSVKRQYYVSSASGLPVEGLVSRVDMNFPDYELETGAYTIYRITGDNNEIVESLTNNFANDSDYRYRLNNAQKFGMYTLGSIISPLPVELVSFKAQRHAQGVNLTWMTASEKDNSGFEVQVSTDGKKFQKIGFVKSEVGTTSMAQRYSFLDTKAVSGTRYYRLAQIDLDGTTTYSAIRAVALDGANGEIAAYPNPFEEVVTVKLNGVEARKVNVILTNSMGKVMLEQEEETAGNTVTVNTSGITTKGIYMLHVVDNGEKHTFKVMKR